MELDNQTWECDPHSSSFGINEGNDTTFSLIVNEIDPKHDLFRDVLVFWQIPFDTGLFIIDTAMLLDIRRMKVEFVVYEFGFDYPEQEYVAVPDSLSYVNVEFLDKSTREFRLSFYLKMSGWGGDWTNLTYPPEIIFSNGYATGTIGFE